MPSRLLRLCFIPLLFAACDETSSKVRTDYVERHREAFVFEGTTHEYVRNVLRDLLAEQGFELQPGDGATLRTSTRVFGRGTEEYAVHFIDMRWKRGFTVELVRIQRGADGKIDTSDRSQDLEWELIRRADPDRAVEIMSNANVKADQVPARAHRHD